MSNKEIEKTLTNITEEFALLEESMGKDIATATNRLDAVIATLKVNGIVVIETNGGGPYQSCKVHSV